MRLVSKMWHGRTLITAQSVGRVSAAVVIGLIIAAAAVAAVAAGVRATIAADAVNVPLVVIALTVLVVSMTILAVIFIGTIAGAPGFRTGWRHRETRGPVSAPTFTAAEVAQATPAGIAHTGTRAPDDVDELTPRRRRRTTDQRRDGVFTDGRLIGTVPTSVDHEPVDVPVDTAAVDRALDALDQEA